MMAHRKTLKEIIAIEPGIECALIAARLAQFDPETSDELYFFCHTIKRSFNRFVGWGCEKEEINNSDDYDTVYHCALHLLDGSVVPGMENWIHKCVAEWLEDRRKKGGYFELM
jgi:hypothetical protein